MNKLNILLVEKRESEIMFFTQSLQLSGLLYLCNVARSMQQALTIVHKKIPDAVFVDSAVAIEEQTNMFKQLQAKHKTPVIYYVTGMNFKHNQEALKYLNYVQLPGNIQSMARILKNLFRNNY